MIDVTANLLADYQTLAERAGWCWVRGRTQVELTGADRQRFMHNYCTADVLKLQPGDGCEAFVTSVQGRTVGHGFLFATAESLVWDSEPGWNESFLTHLDRYLLRDDVQLVDRTSQRGWQCWIVGPQGVEQVERLGWPVPPIELGQNVSGPGSDAIWIRRLPILRVPCLAIVLGAETEVRRFSDQLAAAGLAEVDPAALEMHRLEAGFPRFGIDLDHQNLPQELRRDRQAISFTKGCYLGQETVARIDALGHVNRHFVGLRFALGSRPEVGMKLTLGDKDVGHTTSVAYSPRLAAPSALGYIRREHAAPGTCVGSAAGPVVVERIPVLSQQE